MRWRVFVVAMLALTLGCERSESLRALPAPTLRTHYLIDYEYRLDPATGTATMGHLLVLNPGARPAEIAVTVFFEDRDPAEFHLVAAAGTTTDSAYGAWPVAPGSRFALAVTSSEPVIAQATMGWNSTGNNYSAGVTSKSPHGPREAALSYMATPALATRWWVADGLILDKPSALWVRETEDALILNPNDEPATVQLALFYKYLKREHTIEVPARRLRSVALQELVLRPGLHYGARFASDRPIAAQWRRNLYWNDSPEIMSFWSVPAVPFTTLAEGSDGAPTRN